MTFKAVIEADITPSNEATQQFLDNLSSEDRQKILDVILAE